MEGGRDVVYVSVKIGLYICVCACVSTHVERLDCVWRRVICVYVENKMWGVQGEMKLYGGVFV